MASIANIKLEYKYALQDQVKLLEEVNSPATDDVRDRAIAEAIRWYSRRLPQIVTALVAPISTGFYPVPADFLNGSRIVSIEFPTDQTPPSYLSPKAWAFQRREGGLFYYLLPNPNTSYRLTYTAKHNETTPATIPVEHEAIVGKLAAHVAALEFAAFYARTVQNNLDAINYRSKEQEWRAVADKLLTLVDAELKRDEYAQWYATDPDTYGRGWMA